MVEIGANRQPCEPPTTLLFKLVLEVVIGVGDCLHRRENPRHERSNPCKGADHAGMVWRDDKRS